MAGDPITRKVVLSLGGSIIKRDEDDVQYLNDIRALLMGLNEDISFIIVTGGGRTARDHIRLGRDLGADETTLDRMGIAATRLNSWLIISLLGDRCYPVPFQSIEEALKGAAGFQFVVGGGTHPGHTTDAVSAMIAERWKADLFINLTAVNGAYTSDPNVDENAEKIDEMSSSELISLVSSTEKKAGSHSVMDPMAAEVIHRAGIKTSILNGRDLGSLADCIDERSFDGTRILPE